MHTAQKMKFFIKDFFSKCDQIRSFLWIWSHLLNKPLMGNFIFCAVGLQEHPIGTWTPKALEHLTHSKALDVFTYFC